MRPTGLRTMRWSSRWALTEGSSGTGPTGMRRRTSLLKRSSPRPTEDTSLSERAGRTRPGATPGSSSSTAREELKGSITVGGANPGDRAASVVQVSNVEYAFRRDVQCDREGRGGGDRCLGRETLRTAAGCAETTRKTAETTEGLAAETPAYGPLSHQPRSVTLSGTIPTQTASRTPENRGLKALMLLSSTQSIARLPQQRPARTAGTSSPTSCPATTSWSSCPPEGMVFTTLDAGDDDTRDSDANRTTGMTEKITPQGRGEAGLVGCGAHRAATRDNRPG